MVLGGVVWRAGEHASGALGVGLPCSIETQVLEFIFNFDLARSNLIRG